MAPPYNLLVAAIQWAGDYIWGLTVGRSSLRVEEVPLRENLHCYKGMHLILSSLHSESGRDLTGERVF